MTDVQKQVLLIGMSLIVGVANFFIAVIFFKKLRKITEKFNN